MVNLETESNKNIKLNIDAEISTTPVEGLSESILVDRKISLFIKREDQCHPIISGNKWHKLRFNLEHAKRLGFQKIVSFGGAWSNHIHALAYACQKENLDLLALIRGEELAKNPLNPMLKEAQAFGAKLHFISRSDYRKKTDESFLLSLDNDFGPRYVIPEGGANASGVLGSKVFALNCLQEFFRSHQRYPSHVVLACGSGTTTAGFLQALAETEMTEKKSIKVIAYAAAKDASLQEKIIKLSLLKLIDNKVISALALSKINWQLRDMSGKGFGKLDREQQSFMESFEQKHQISLDPVYTAKLFHQVFLDIEQGYFQEGSCILVLHSGGMQGARSLSVEC